MRRAMLAASLVIGGAASAHAFGLGHAVVRSVLGQPLSVDVDIADISASEASTLRVGIAPPSEFSARKLNYNSSILENLTIAVKHRADGRAYLHLAGSVPVHDPYLDLLLDAFWGDGEMVRDYTLLVDPAGFAQPPAVTPIAPQLSTVPSPAYPAAQGSEASRLAQQHVAGQSAQETPGASVRPARSRPARAANHAGTTHSGTYVVGRGDTLSSVASRFAQPGVSLDQMLVALYRSNSGAFIDHNMNLVRVGAILQLPDAAQAGALHADEARHEVVVQSKDFDAYRRRLAEMTGQEVPRPSSASRQAQGKIQAEVREPVPAASVPQSRLVLSKAAAGTRSGAQESDANSIAERQQAAAVAAKLAAARSTVAELNRLAASAARAASAAIAASAPHPASVSSSSVLPGITASASHARRRAAVPPPPHPSPPVRPAPGGHGDGSWIARLAGNPLLLPGGLAVAVLLGALVFMRRRAKTTVQRDNTVFDSRVTSADSFFGGSGGERVDTRNSTLGSSMAYTPSQLDPADVDPVAEADVYLAYGRDLQAEEILKEALKTHPERNAARLKLLEIYAKRKDARSFEMTAAELFARTEGAGADWKKAQDLGRNLDPVNPLYQNTQPPVPGSGPSTIPSTDFAPSGASLMGGSATLPATEVLREVPARRHAPAPAGPERDDGLDLSLDLALSGPAGMTAQPPQPQPQPNLRPQSEVVAQATPVSQTAVAPVAKASFEPLDFELSGFDLPSLGATSAESLTPGPASASATSASVVDTLHPLAFDLSELSLDLEPPKLDAPTQQSVEHDDGLDAAPAVPLEAPTLVPHADAASADSLDTRLELVEECRAMGDLDMARSLLGEIIAESDGPTRAHAETLLAQLG